MYTNRKEQGSLVNNEIHYHSDNVIDERKGDNHKGNKKDRTVGLRQRGNARTRAAVALSESVVRGDARTRAAVVLSLAVRTPQTRGRTQRSAHNGGVHKSHSAIKHKRGALSQTRPNGHVGPPHPQGRHTPNMSTQGRGGREKAEGFNLGHPD